MGAELNGPARLARRVLPGLAVLLSTALLAGTAAAFTIDNPGFAASLYSSGYATDGTHGPRATAWDGNTLWAVDAADGGLYASVAASGPGPGVALHALRLGTVAGGVNGLAVGKDGRLYATLVNAHEKLPQPGSVGS